MTRTIRNSIIVRVEHHYPTDDWLDAVTDLHVCTAAQSRGEVDTIPGPTPGQVDWLFESDEDAAWFVLKYNGRIIDKNDPSLAAIFAGFLG